MKTKILLFALLGMISLGYSQTSDNFEPNESFATNSSINLCANYNATIGQTGDIDYYSTNVTNGQTLNINIFYIPNNLTLKVTLFDSSNVELINWTSSGSISQDYTPSSTSLLNIKKPAKSANFLRELNSAKNLVSFSKSS